MELPDFELAQVPAIFSAIFPVLVGGAVTKFDLFILRPEEFQDKVNFRKAKLVENLALLHAELLELTRRQDEVLRGDGRIGRDLISEYTKTSIDLFAKMRRLDFMRHTVEISHVLLFLSMIPGFIGLFCAFLFPEYVRAIFFIGPLSVFLQFLIIMAHTIVGWRFRQGESVP